MVFTLDSMNSFFIFDSGKIDCVNRFYLCFIQPSNFRHLMCQMKQEAKMVYGLEQGIIP